MRHEQEIAHPRVDLIAKGSTPAVRKTFRLLKANLNVSEFTCIGGKKLAEHLRTAAAAGDGRWKVAMPRGCMPLLPMNSRMLGFQLLGAEPLAEMHPLILLQAMEIEGALQTLKHTRDTGWSSVSSFSPSVTNYTCCISSPRLATCTSSVPLSSSSAYSAACAARVSISTRSLCSAPPTTLLRCQASGISRLQLIRFASQLELQPIGDLKPPQRIKQWSRRVRQRDCHVVARAHDIHGAPRRSWRAYPS